MGLTTVELTDALLVAMTTGKAIQLQRTIPLQKLSPQGTDPLEDDSHNSESSGVMVEFPKQDCKRLSFSRLNTSYSHQLPQNIHSKDPTSPDSWGSGQLTDRSTDPTGNECLRSTATQFSSLPLPNTATQVRFYLLL